MRKKASRQVVTKEEAERGSVTISTSIKLRRRLRISRRSLRPLRRMGLTLQKGEDSEIRCQLSSRESRRRRKSFS